MAIVNNSGYNNPALGQAFDNIASIFAPPTAAQIVANNVIAKNNFDQAEYQKGIDAVTADPNLSRLAPLYRLKAADPAGAYADSVGLDALIKNPNDPRALDPYVYFKSRNFKNTGAGQLSEPLKEGDQRILPPNVATSYGVPQTQTNVAEETPVLKDVRQPDGSVQPTWVKPGEGTGVPLGAPAKPDAVDPAKLAEERAKNQAKQEADTAARSQTAESMIPHIDRAMQAYQTLKSLNAIGPASASGVNRFLGGLVGADAEKARQAYEAAANELQLFKAQISMKGQGSISDAERKLLSFTLPRLDAADPETGLTTLQQMRTAANAAMTKAGKNAPTAPTAQPAVPAQPATAGVPAPQSAAEYAALPSGTRFTAPDGSVRIKP